jgi:hypothetical protein
LDKIEKNSLKYPVEKSKGSATKYTELWLYTNQISRDF